MIITIFSFIIITIIVIVIITIDLVRLLLLYIRIDHIVAYMMT